MRNFALSQEPLAPPRETEDDSRNKKNRINARKIEPTTSATSDSYAGAKITMMTKPKPKSVLSVDVGRRRIGLAGCDPLGISISRLPAIFRKSFEEDIEILAKGEEDLLIKTADETKYPANRRAEITRIN